MSDARERAAVQAATERYGAGDNEAARAICVQLLQRNRRCEDALRILGTIEARRRNWDQCVSYFERCIRLRPESAQYVYLLAKARLYEGHLDEAVAQYDKALVMKPVYREAVAGKAAALERMGKRDEARTLLEPFIETQNETHLMVETFAKLLMRSRRLDESIELLARHADREDLTPEDRANLRYLQGRAYERMGEFDRAFTAYKRANEDVRMPFDPQEWVHATDRIIAAFSKKRIDAMPRSRHDASSAVLIAGMPRSGTTLVEQIMDAHPVCAGAGEARELAMIAGTMHEIIRSDRTYPECIDDLTRASISGLGRRYLNRVARRHRGAARIVNKSIENYKLLGLASAMLPGARVIHIQRSPLDTCISCYFSHLTPMAYPYATDLRSLGTAYGQYERLMDHWRNVVDLPMLEVKYEELVAQPEEWIRAIIDFCNLEWDDRCLQFFDSGRFAMTLSYEQVRQPVYRSSVGRHKKFEQYIRPLRDALNTPQRRGDEAVA